MTCDSWGVIPIWLGIGPRLIPDQLLSANHQATLARGVRLSLAERWALSCRRLWVSWAQTLSKRSDLSRARKVRTPWPPSTTPSLATALKPGVENDHARIQGDHVTPFHPPVKGS